MLSVIENDNYNPYFKPSFFDASEMQIVKMFNVIIKNSVPEHQLAKYFNYKTAYTLPKLKELIRNTRMEYGSKELRIEPIIDIEFDFQLEYFGDSRYCISSYRPNVRLKKKYPTMSRILYAAGILKLRLL